jgi:hypothetical protein
MFDTRSERTQFMSHCLLLMADGGLITGCI